METPEKPTPPKPHTDKKPFVAGLPDGPLERPSDFPDYDGPLVCPFYGPDHPARRDEESKEAFNEDVARVAFGCLALNQVQEWQGSRAFYGDWWLWCFLHQRLLVLQTSGPQDIQLENRFRAWNAMVIDLFARGIAVHLEQVELCNMPLQGISLHRCHAEGASLLLADLSHANLSWTHLQHASISLCNLQHAFMIYARMSGSCLSKSRCMWASLQFSDLSKSDLSQTILRGAKLKDVDLDESDLRDAKMLLFDDNPADRMRIEGNAPDPWSVLRRTYTGPRYFVHLVLTLAFLLPFALKAFHLTALGEAYAAVAGVAVERGHEGLDAAIPRAGLRELLDRFDRHHAPAPAWWVLVGGLDAWYFALMTMVVAAYNLLRIILTLGVPAWMVSAAPRTSVGGVTALREAEERSRVTPALEDYYGPLHPLSEEYKRRVLGWRERDGKLQPPERERGRVERVAREWAWLAVERLKYNPRFPMMTIGLYRMHLFARLLFWFAASAFVFHLMHWVLTATVPVPVDALL